MFGKEGEHAVSDDLFSRDVCISTQITELIRWKIARGCSFVTDPAI